MDVNKIENLTFDEMRPISVSFKKDDDELTLYKWSLKHGSLSGFIKDLLRAAKENETPKSEIKNCEVKQTGLIDMDF